jgi:crotonobetainyl-CoA:carnitine CoA-transferase CaiB-like acyl-CoA transferase
VTSFDMDGREVKSVSSPFDLCGIPRSDDRAPPALAAHTGEILRELGQSEDDINALDAQGAFGPPGSYSNLKGV